MSLTTATEHEIVQTFLRIPYENLRAHNWRTAGDRKAQAMWDVTDGTYINGVVLTIDQDFSMGYLIEVIDVETGDATYAVVVTFSESDKDGSQRFEYFFMPGPLLGGMSIGQEDAASWAVRVIFGLMESYEDRLAAGALGETIHDLV